MCGGRIGLGREDEMNENVSGITNSWDRKVYLADFDVIKKRSLTVEKKVSLPAKKDKGKVKSKSVSAKCFQVVMKGCNNQHISRAAGVL